LRRHRRGEAFGFLSTAERLVAAREAAQVPLKAAGEDRDDKPARKKGPLTPGRPDRQRADADAGGDGERHVGMRRTVATRRADRGMRRCQQQRQPDRECSSPKRGHCFPLNPGVAFASASAANASTSDNDLP
jgi:hypothetical protein